MSDNLDCSLLVKEASIQNADMHYQLLLGVACLSVLAPYSVAYDSSQSLLFHYYQHRPARASAYIDGYLKKKCQLGDKGSEAHCELRDYISHVNGFVDVSTTFEKSAISNVWKSKGINQTIAQKYLFRAGKEERVYQMPYKLVHMIDATSKKNPTLANEIAVKLGYSNLEAMKRSSRIALNSTKIDRILVHFFVQSNTTQTPQHYLELTLPRERNHRQEDDILLHIPYRADQPTSSIFTAFIVYSTYGCADF